MKIALIADIHANAWALDAVLEDIGRQNPDAIFHLGDILHGPLQPRDTYERLRGILIQCTIAGNQDRDLWQATPEAIRASPSLQFILDDLPPQAIDWLRELPATATREGIFLCHGTPASDCTYLLEDVSSGRALVKPEAEIVALLNGVQELVVACGHSHIPRALRLAATGQLIVNPGSVGLPAYSDDSPVPHVMETATPHASYAILENHTVSHRLVPYDWKSAAEFAARYRPDWAYQLSTGRVPARHL